jgi:hypothetical protein
MSHEVATQHDLTRQGPAMRRNVGALCADLKAGASRETTAHGP